MAVIGLFAGLVVPAFHAIGYTQGVNQGVYEVAALLELARKEAVTRQTYVWVGFENTIADGSAEVRIAAAASRDGTDRHSAADNLFALTRALRLRNVRMGEWSDLRETTRGLHDGPLPVSVAANADGVAFSAGSVHFNGCTITFTPGGQAMLAGSPGLDGGYDSLMEVSLRQTRGDQIPDNANDGAVILHGSTGTPRIILVR